MNKDVAFFLPTRKGSQRVLNKNTRQFSDLEGGLLELKLRQLLQVDGVGAIILSTDDPRSMEIARGFEAGKKEIRIVERPEELAAGNTLVEDFINYIPTIMPAEHIFWVHATAPFVTARDYEETLRVYFDTLKRKEYDSVLSVTKFQQFLWSVEQNDIINCDRSVNKWPNTQDLTPLYEVNHAFYLSSKANYRKFSDRIGEKPMMYILDKIKSFDIDHEEDFLLAEIIYDRFFRS